MSAFPAIDRGEIERFVGVMFRYADPGAYVSLRAFRDGKGGEGWPVRSRAVAIGETLDPLIDAAAEFAGECAAAAEPWVCCPPVATFRAGNGAAEEDLANGLAIVAECDAAPRAARERLEILLGPATLIVASGGIWIDPATSAAEPKLHLYWRLKEPTGESADHAALKAARRLAAQLVGADLSAAPVCHPMRWPGTWHRKGEPRLARISSLNPDAEIELQDALDNLREAAGAAGACDPGRHGEANDPEADLQDIAAALAMMRNDDLPWAEWNRIGMAAWAASGGSEEGFAAFAYWSSKSGKFDPAETRRRWGHYRTSPPGRIGAGTLFYLARQADSDFVKPSNRILTQEGARIAEAMFGLGEGAEAAAGTRGERRAGRRQLKECEPTYPAPLGSIGEAREELARVFDEHVAAVSAYRAQRQAYTQAVKQRKARRAA
jgi:hypothetical protein